MAKYNDIKKMLRTNGFVYIRNGKGSHEIWKHPESKIKTILTKHTKEISSGVERSIRKAVKESNYLLGGKYE